MKKENFNNPYRKVPNRIGKVKGNMGIFNEPTPLQRECVEENGVDIESIFEDVEDIFEDDEIVITFSPKKFLFWFLIINVICFLIDRM